MRSGGRSKRRRGIDRSSFGGSGRSSSRRRRNRGGGGSRRRIRTGRSRGSHARRSGHRGGFSCSRYRKVCKFSERLPNGMRIKLTEFLSAVTGRATVVRTWLRTVQNFVRSSTVPNLKPTPALEGSRQLRKVLFDSCGCMPRKSGVFALHYRENETFNLHYAIQ